MWQNHVGEGVGVCHLGDFGDDRSTSTTVRGMRRENQAMVPSCDTTVGNGDRMSHSMQNRVWLPLRMCSAGHTQRGQPCTCTGLVLKAAPHSTDRVRVLASPTTTTRLQGDRWSSLKVLYQRRGDQTTRLCVNCLALGSAASSFLPDLWAAVA